MIAIGDIVLARVGGPDETPELRPAIVVRVWSEDCCNAQVLLDGINDRIDHLPGEQRRDPTGVAWCTSITRGDAVGQWRQKNEPAAPAEPKKAATKRAGGEA